MVIYPYIYICIYTYIYVYSAFNYLLKIVIFHSYVSLPVGNVGKTMS